MAQMHSADEINEQGGQDRTTISGGSHSQPGVEFKSGEIIGESYEVLRWIGAGGMGNVYAVRHIILDTEYALKTLSADKVTEVAWRRFQNEAQAIGRMQHQNIVAIYNLGLHKGTLPFYVMDLLQGKSLEYWLKARGALPVNEVLALSLEVADGLGYAHKKGIIHRDIKPPNILLLDNPEPSCRIKILDFGIAKLSQVSDPNNQFLTRAGEVCGSPLYMSPEQALGDRIDARSDLYSFGCTIFELLTGVPPFRGRSAMETMMMQQSAQPPTLSSAAGGHQFPEMLENVVATLLAKAPRDRYQSMELLSQDLRTIISGQPTSINPFGSIMAQTTPLAAIGARSRAGGETFGAPNQDWQEGEEEIDSTGNRAPLLVIGGILSCLVLAGATAFLFFANQSKRPSDLERPVMQSTAKADLNAFLDLSTQFAGADRLVGDRNKNVKNPNLKEDKPYCQIEKIKGKKARVFEFPTDITIGDMRSPSSEDLPARGHLEFSMRGDLEFAPEKILVDYPQYLKRFRAGDVHSLKIEGVDASDKLMAVCCTLPGVKRLHLENCQNLTEKSLPYIDQMPDLDTLMLEGKSLSAENIAKLKCLPSLRSVVIRNNLEPGPFLKVLEGLKNLKNLSIDHGNLDADCFKSIATMTNLVHLSLKSSIFQPFLLKDLVALPHLNGINLTNSRVDRTVLFELKKLKHLKKVTVSPGKKSDPVPLELIKMELLPVKVESEGKEQDLPISGTID